jgi:PAS domain S-box-containing protein
MDRPEQLPDPPPPGSPVADCLRALPAFMGFADEELWEIAPFFQEFGSSVGENLIVEGAPSDNRVYFLLSGQLSVMVNGKTILTLARRGDIVGEVGLVDREFRSATVRAAAPSRLLVLSSARDFFDGDSHSYRLRFAFARMYSAILADKLRLTSDKARRYEEAVLETRKAEAHNADLEEQIGRTVRRIRLFSHLVDSAKDAVLIADLNGKVEQANPAFLRDFDQPGNVIVGRSLESLLGLGQDGIPMWEVLDRESRERGWSGEVSVQTRGSPIPAECSFSLVEGAQGEPLAHSVVLRDIRERKAFQTRILRQQKELEAAYHDLQAVDRLKDRFLTRVSHELRTPLTGVLASLEMLCTPGMIEMEEHDRFLDLVFEEARRLASRVDKLLAIAKIESNQMPFQMEEASIEPLVDMALVSVRPLADRKRLTLTFERGSGTGPVHMDSEQIRIALTEVLDNAVRYTDHGSIRVHLREMDGQVEIRVEDTGRGIDPGATEFLFDTLGQVRATDAPLSNEEAQALGLGLPLSRLIVSAHCGRLGVKSTPGAGSTFWIRLPLASAKPSGAAAPHSSDSTCPV